MALLTYFLVYFALAFVWRSIVVYRRSGQNPFVLPADDTAYGYVGRAFKAVMISTAALVTLNAVDPEAVAGFGEFSLLRLPLLRIMGWVLLIASLAWLLIAQAQTGNSWRIGIDAENRTALVTRGLFTVSRSPIFLAMRVNLLGLFLVLPHGVTLAILVAGEVLIQVQVRLEEQHLTSLHGEPYAHYRIRVRRWV